MHAFRICAVAASALAASAACGGSSNYGTNPGNTSAASLAIAVQPTAIAPAGIITPAVKVSIRDSYGSLVTSSSAAVTVALGTNPGGTLSGTLTRTASGGVATFNDLSIDNAGTGYTLVATSSGLASATSSGFDVVATGPSAPPAKVAFIVQPTSVLQGTAINPAVKVAVQDSNGVTVTGSTAAVTIGIGTNPGVDTLSGTRTVNAVNGVATFANLSIDSVGTGYTLTAASTGLTGATSNAFDVTAPSPVPLAITITTVGLSYKSVRNNSTHPAVDTLKVTGTATWTNLSTIHLVESIGSPSFVTQTASANQYQITFNITGTYQYDCAVHGPSMDGRIEVVP